VLLFIFTVKYSSMKRLDKTFRISFIALIISTLTFSACDNHNLSESLTGTYTGNSRIISRYYKDGQYIFYEDNVDVSIQITSNQIVSGHVGRAVFEDCKVLKNRGWIGRQLNIKTDFLITGKLLGSTFSRDSILNKDISIPFNSGNGELKGSLFLTNKEQNLPIISILRLVKQ
jgi:hypothetical protein